MLKGTIVAILLLHGPTGREIRVNTTMVTSLHAPQAPGQSKAMADNAKCLINTADGKFVSVIETCAEVARMMSPER